MSCAQLSYTLEPDNGLCARMDERTCIRVITVDVTSSVQAENKCSAVAMWMVRHKHSSCRGWPKLPPPGVLALCQLRTHAVKDVSDQHLQTVRTRLSRSTSAVATPPSSSSNGSPSSPAQARHSDLRTNYKQFGLKAISSQIENQPNHARSTNIHRATHAENYGHLNCDTNCFETSNANLPRDSFNLLALQRIRSSGLHRTIAGVQPSCFTSSRSSTFPDFSCVLLHYEVSSWHSTNCRFASRFQQLILKFIRLVSKLVRLASKLSVTLFHLDT